MRSSRSLTRRAAHVLVAAVVGVVTLWTFVTPASAASTFSGVATWEDPTGKAPFATAVLTRTGFSTLTTTADVNGNFSFAAVPDGQWRLVVTSPCSVPSPVKVVLPADPLVLPLTKQNDAFGYRCRTATQSQPAAGTALALTGDDAVADVALPFPFPLYDEEVSALTVSTNGWISGDLTGGSAPTNTGLPSFGNPDRAVYAFWDDLLVDASASVRTRSTMNGSNGFFEVQWLNVALESDPAQRLNAYVRLNEFNDSIVIVHHGVGTGSGEQGASATVGIEGPGAVTALEVSHDQPVAVNGRSYVFVPTPSDPVAEAGNSQQVASEAAFFLDASGSSDADGGPLTFSWVQIAGPAGSFDDPSRIRPRVQAPQGPASLRFRVTVTDVFGNSDVDDVIVTVQGPPSK